MFTTTHVRRLDHSPGVDRSGELVNSEDISEHAHGCFRFTAEHAMLVSQDEMRGRCRIRVVAIELQICSGQHMSDDILVGAYPCSST